MEAVSIDIDARSFAAVQSAFVRAPEIAATEMNVFMTRWVAHLEGEVMERTPTAHGTLRASIFGEVNLFSGGLGVEGLVGTSSDHAAPVELGTKPHPVGKKGIAALTAWAEQKFGVRGQEAEAVAHRVAWKIRHHGTKGAFMFAKTFEANQAGIVGDFERTFRRLVARIAKEVQ